MSSPFDRYHTVIVMSLFPDAKNSSLGENTTLREKLVKPERDLVCFQLGTFQTPIS